MKKYRVVDVSETKLEDLVRRAPELVEEGLRFVDHQVATDRGPLDVLLVDSGGALVIAELKVAEDDGALIQGLDYYDYVMRNLDAFARAYKKHKIDASQEARLILIAPSFSERTLSRIKWINVPVSLFLYQCLKFGGEDDDLTPVFNEVTAPELTERPEKRSLEDHFNYITNPSVRSLARRALDEILSWDPQRLVAEARKGYIPIKLSGRSMAWMGFRRNYFRLGARDEEYRKITEESDLESYLPVVRAVYERMKGG